MRRSPARRSKGGARASVVLVVVALIAVPTPAALPPAPAGTFVNPLVRDGADPFIAYCKGYYYFLSTASTCIRITKASTLAGLARARPKTVWTPPPKGPNSVQIWAPELHNVRGKWYLYYTATTADGNDGNRRCWALEAVAEDPLGPYKDRGKVYDPKHDHYAIDATVFERASDSALFFLWSGRPPGGEQSICIAPMQDPWTLSGPRVVLSSPTHSWERIGWPVDEGPAVIEHGGKTFIAYSASGGTTADYCLGLLVNTGDLLDRDSWTKWPCPVFHRYAGPDGSVFTPGHHGFFKSPDGTEDWIIYHGKDATDGSWGGRSARAQRFSWDAAGLPLLGHPVPPGVPLAVPSGEKGRKPLPGGLGTGLRGEYFKGKDFATPAGVRTDPTIDFDWQLGAPLSGMDPDRFSIRWRGKIEPRFSETYTFLAYSDDGVRLWIDDKPVIDDWHSHFATASAGTIALHQGKRHDIRIEYYEDDISANLSLWWKSPKQPFEVVPASQLYPE